MDTNDPRFMVIGKVDLETGKSYPVEPYEVPPAPCSLCGEPEEDCKCTDEELEEYYNAPID